MASLTTKKKSAKIENYKYRCDACNYGTDDISNLRAHEKQKAKYVMRT